MSHPLKADLLEILQDMKRTLADISPFNPYGLPIQSINAPPTTVSLKAKESLVCALSDLEAGLRKCEVCGQTKNFVMGSGLPGAKLMFIGYMPDALSFEKGHLTGEAPELLGKIINAIKLKKEEIYVTHLIKCQVRLPESQPAPDFLEKCLDFLKQEIAIVKPKVMVIMGEQCAKLLIASDKNFIDLQGQFFKVLNQDALVTYQPLDVIKNESLKRPLWEDIKKVMLKLGSKR